MSFHDVRFPGAISFGSSGGVERRTEVVTLANGFEERNSPWSQSRRRYDAGLGIQNLDDLDQVLAFFEARRGRLFGFRWKDWLDHRSGAPSVAVDPGDQVIGVGDGATSNFALSKTYQSGGFSTVRTISHPMVETVRVAVGGVEQVPGAGFLVNGGLVELSAAPASGVTVTAGFEFDVPVRFDTDVIEVNLAAFEAGEIPSVPIIEVRL
ncbi:MAG: DUF2460 domain-containing protein [Pseudomonadota bacterium]